MAVAGKFIGGLRFGVSMDTKRLNKDVKRARGTINKFTASVKKSLFSIKGLALAIGTVGLTRFATDAFLAIDSLAKVSAKLGLTTEALAGLRLAAKETGIDMRQLDIGLQRMTRRFAEAAMGSGEAKEAIKTLGLDAKKLIQLAPDQIFLAVADAMGKVENQSEQLRLAFKLFDSEGAGLVSTLRLGRAEIEKTTQDAKKLGLAVSQETAKGVEKAIDEFNRFKDTVGSIFKDLAITITPFVTGLSKDLRQITQDIRNLNAAVKKTGIQSTFSEIVRGIGLTSGGTGQFGFSQFVRAIETGGASLITDRGPRSTPAGPNNRQFSTMQSATNFADMQAEGKVFRELSGFLKRLTQRGSNIARGAGLSAAQGAGGIANLPLARALPFLLGNISNLVQETPAERSAKDRQSRQNRSGRSDLEFTQAGSAASFRQRAAIRRANEQQKLDIKRNKTLDDIKDQLVKSPVVLLPANL